VERGQKFYIEPSDGFCDISSGEVQIVRISSYEDVVEEYADPEYIAQDDPSAKEERWIVYKYTKPHDEDTYAKYALNESLFLDHVMEVR